MIALDAGVALLTACALFGAVVSAMVGLGGGAFLIGAMVLLGVPVGVAVPLHALVQLASNTTRTIAFLPHVRWSYFGALALPAVPGIIVGLALRNQLDAKTVSMLLGVVVVIAAWSPRRGLSRVPGTLAFAIAGAIGGLLGPVIGAVGAVIGPFLLRDDMTKESMVATNAVCSSYMHVLKVIAFASISFAFGDYWHLLIPMAIATVLGTYVGQLLHDRLSERVFIVLFRGSLTLLAIGLIHDALRLGSV